MATTTNFGWETPDDTDLVKDGALAIRTLGSAIDTSLVDLKGGTTGQVLSKTSNTDMDFTWVTSDDANAIQNTIVDAKGDLISASASDVPARLAVGNNGETLVANSSASVGLSWQGNFAAGKNKIVNGDFSINQRNFTSVSTNDTFTFDRWNLAFSGGTVTCTPQTFTAGSAPIAGYEGVNFAQIVTASQSAVGDFAIYRQRIEDVRTFANQTITFSFFARATSGTPQVSIELDQTFGSGGSAAVQTQASSAFTLSTSWTRYSTTITLPTISGKTIGTNNFLAVNIWLSAGSTFASRSNSIGVQNNTFQIWGVQLEAGSVATAFQTATGTLAGELAACQRYYWRFTSNGTSASVIGQIGIAYNTTDISAVFKCPVTMRTTPTSLDYANVAVLDVAAARSNITSVTILDSAPDNVRATLVGSGFTAQRSYLIYNQSGATGYIGYSAEL